MSTAYSQAEAATASYTYDELNRLTSATIDGSRIEYTYDSAGNIEKVITPYAISVTKSGDGAGIVADDLLKLNCGDDCDGVYDLNTVVILSATPDTGSAFDGWTGGGCSGTETCEITASSLDTIDAVFVLTPVEEADLVITKTDGQTTVTPGGSTTYTIVVSNNGPSGVTDAFVSDTFPANLTCTYTSAGAGGASGNTPTGTGNITDILSLPASASVTYTVPCDIAADATGALSNTATVVSAVSDPEPGDESATDNSTLEQSADLVVTKTDGVESAIPGESTSYTIVVANNGPSDVAGASVTDTFPNDLTCTYSSISSGGATGYTAVGVGDISDTLNLPVGSSVTYTAPCEIGDVATGTLSNTASIISAVNDPEPGDESATDTTLLVGEADLSITKTDGVDSVIAGRSNTYTIKVSNNGPSSVSDASVLDTFPTELTCTYTSVPAAGATGNSILGDGHINDTLNLPSGASVTYSAECDVDPDATGTLSNTATVSSSMLDPKPGNESATDDSEIQTLEDEVFLNGFEDR